MACIRRLRFCRQPERQGVTTITALYFAVFEAKAEHHSVTALLQPVLSDEPVKAT